MDADRFDALSRALSAARSRRGTFRGILGVLFGDLLLPATFDPDAIAGRHKGKQKRLGSKQRGQWRQGLNRKSNGKNAEGQREDGRAGAEACKPPGARCTKAKERKCCSKQCSNKGKCLCTAANQCPQPSNSCQQAVCSRGACGKRNKAPNAACTTDNNPCTNDLCNANGQCTHPAKANGATCRVQGSEGACQSGQCVVPAECTPGAVCRAASCNGLILTKEATCQSNGTCPDEEQENCDDGIACTDDTCEPVNGCTHVANDTNCPVSGQVCDPLTGCACPSPQVECGGSCTTVGESCTTGNQGICATGTRQCVNGNNICVGIQPGSQPEICGNGLDDNCDGQTDELGCINP